MPDGSRRRVMALRVEQAAWLEAEILRLADRWALDRHPLHERWAAGALDAVELQTYAAEYHSVVDALADVAQRAAHLGEGLLRHALADHARERARDVEDWCAFARATGWSSASAWYFACDPLPETEAVAAAWRGGPERTLAEHLVTLVVADTLQAAAAPRQVDALRRQGGIVDAGTRWFEMRLRRDAGPAGLVRAALAGLLPVADPDALVRHAEAVLRGHSSVLDAVDRWCAEEAARASADAPRPASAAPLR